MTSIFRKALGSDFDRLHPQLQRRFSVGLDSGEACIGRGVMEQVWHDRGFVRPFLALGATRHILVPQVGAGVPFRIENFPYRDRYGRETVTFARTFSCPGGRERHWDATMIHSPVRGCCWPVPTTTRPSCGGRRPSCGSSSSAIRSSTTPG